MISTLGILSLTVLRMFAKRLGGDAKLDELDPQSLFHQDMPLCMREDHLAPLAF